LVVTGCDEATGEATVEVVHEALIRGWERLREWMEKERDFRIWQEGLRAAMRQWVASGKDNGVLLRGKPLAEAENWLQQREEDLQAEQDYIRASLARRQQEIEEQDYQKQQLELLRWVKSMPSAAMQKNSLINIKSLMLNREFTGRYLTTTVE
jgi:hypothetical protein